MGHPAVFFWGGGYFLFCFISQFLLHCFFILSHFHFVNWLYFILFYWLLELMELEWIAYARLRAMQMKMQWPDFLFYFFFSYLFFFFFFHFFISMRMIPYFVIFSRLIQLLLWLLEFLPYSFLPIPPGVPYWPHTIFLLLVFVYFLLFFIIFFFFHYLFICLFIYFFF